MPLSLAEFVRRWKIASLSESSGAQTHFIDLCDMLGQPHPAAADATGETYTFEKPVSKVYGGEGFADVWKRGHFAWEYKGKKKDLRAAYKQLNDYREDLFNPPLLVVCDLNRFEVHTNFSDTKPRVYSFDLNDLGRNVVTASCPLPPLEVLRALFDLEQIPRLRPEATDAFVTQEAAKTFARLAERLEIEKRALTDTPIHTREEIAHFLMRLLFCLFADNIGLLPRHVFRTLIQSDDRFSARTFKRKLTGLFAAMSEPDGIYGEHTIKYFNGGLFDSGTVLDLDLRDLGILHEAATKYNWSHVAPAIFGTLFERSLKAERRSLIGAHYTSEADIELIVEPVVLKPLRQRWAEVRNSILAILNPPTETTQQPGSVKGTASAVPQGPPGKGASAPEVRSPATAPTSSIPSTQPTLLTSHPQAETLLAAWFDELSAVRILDPACGSGNFLYVALRKLLDLWRQARDFAIHHNIQLAITYAVEKMVSPQQLFGIETEFYAHELASVVVWIGFLQWKHENGILEDKEPILQKLSNIEHNDAILRYDAEGKPYEPTWPKADFIIGNPPFLGGKLLRRELGDRYVEDLFHLWSGRVKAESDLVVYWFEKARAQLETAEVNRVGLLATQGIRGGANRAVLERIQQTGTIFWAWSDRKWLLQGAAVHVSMVAFERTQTADGSQTAPLKGTASAVPPSAILNIAASAAEVRALLNGEPVPFINADLTTGSNTAAAFRLKENAGLCFMGTTKIGPFDIDAETAGKMLAAPLNPNGRPNSDVVRSWVNALDITRRPRNMFIVDFGTDTTEQKAAYYELPFEYVKHHVKPIREKNDREAYALRWWLHGEARGDFRRATARLSRYILTSRVSKHRLFIWMSADTLPDSATFAIARDDNYFFGVLHSSIHELWALTMGTQLESRPRYTPNSTFDTFPFPWPPGTEPTEADSPLVRAIADAARTLVQLRDNWLNPLSPSGEPLPESELKDRTLTKLYNLRAAGKATWLENAHRTLDQAVFAAYGWPYPLDTQDILARLLALNHQRAAANPIPKPTRRHPTPKPE